MPLCFWISIVSDLVKTLQEQHWSRYYRWIQQLYWIIIPYLCNCLKKCSSSCWRGVDSLSALGKHKKYRYLITHFQMNNCLNKIWCCPHGQALLPCCVLHARTGLSPCNSTSPLRFWWKSSKSGSISNLSFFFFFSSGWWDTFMMQVTCQQNN